MDEKKVNLVKMAALGMAVCAITLAGLGLTSCKSVPTTKAAKTTIKTELIEHKGTSLGIIEVPQWLVVSTNGTAAQVEALPEFKDQYVYIPTEHGPALQPLTTWLGQFNVPQAFGAMILTRVASVFKANEGKLPGDPDSQRKYHNAINTLVSVSYSGAQKQGDWFTHERLTERGRGKESYERYTVYAIYSIPKKQLNQQIADQMKKLANENPELEAAFTAVSTQILERGLEWGE
jgi:hypothetical protein